MGSSCRTGRREEGGRKGTGDADCHVASLLAMTDQKQNQEGKMEDKRKITKYLERALKECRAGAELAGLRYEKDNNGETVTVTTAGGWSMRVDVTADSGAALMLDVIRAVM